MGGMGMSMGGGQGEYGGQAGGLMGADQGAMMGTGGSYGTGGGYGAQAQQMQTYFATENRLASTLYVSGVDSNIDEEQLMMFFSVCGRVVNIKMCGDRTKQSRFAFIEFSSPQEAQIGLGLSGMQVGQFAVRVSRSKNVIQSRGPGGASTGGAYRGATGAMSAPRARPRPPRNDDDDDPVRRAKLACTVYASNLHTAQASNADIYSFFRTAGAIDKLCVVGDPASALFAFIEYKSAYDAKKALDLSGQALGNAEIRVEPSRSSIKDDAPANNLVPLYEAGTESGDTGGLPEPSASDDDGKRKREQADGQPIGLPLQESGEAELKKQRMEQQPGGEPADPMQDMAGSPPASPSAIGLEPVEDLDLAV